MAMLSVRHSAKTEGQYYLFLFVQNQNDLITLSRWLETVELKYLQEVDGDSNISWATYHACRSAASTFFLL